MANSSEKQGHLTTIKHMDAKKRKLTVWWIMVGAFGATAIVGMALTGAGHSVYANSISTTKSLRKQLGEAIDKKNKHESELENCKVESSRQKLKAIIYEDQKKIDEINGKLGGGVKTTELAYGVFLDLLAILLLCGIGLYSYGIFSKKVGILYQKKTTLE